LQRIT
jgi:transcriptional regulator GlxA family with amidase domain